MRQNVENFLFMCWQYAKPPLLIVGCVVLGVIAITAPLILYFLGDPVSEWGVLTWEPYLTLVGITFYVPLFIMGLGATLLLTGKPRFPL